MKYFLLIIAAFGITLSSNSEEIQVSAKGENEVSESVYFELENLAEVARHSNDNWDLAFAATDVRRAFIHTNRKYTVYVVPNSDFDTFGNEIDTEGYTEWEITANSESQWNHGSLNLGKDGFENNDFDYGWGAYDISTHYVLGDKVFLLVSQDDMKQLVIDRLASNEYVFKWANTDGTNIQEGRVSKVDGTVPLFVKYDFETNESFLTPDISTYDLVFEKYNSFIPGPNQYYPVTGIRSAPGVEVAELRGVDPNSAFAPSMDAEIWSTNITEIGSDWKQFAGGGYTIPDDLVYFVRRTNESGEVVGNVYRIIPKNFGSDISTLEIRVEGGNVEESSQTLVNVYPNIVESGQQINLDAVTIWDGASITITDIKGNNIAQNEYFAGNINTTNLASGKYFVTISNNGSIFRTQFIVK
ncbi:MAG: hypothetical protein Kapaf2KO_16170 [Candidatus Kapaibacteriales bacterium]